MITEARINGRVRRLAPKRWEDVILDEPCVLARGLPVDPPLSAGSTGRIVEKYDMSTGDGVLIGAFGIDDQLVALETEDLLFPVDELPCELCNDELWIRRSEPMDEWGTTMTDPCPACYHKLVPGPEQTRDREDAFEALGAVGAIAAELETDHPFKSRALAQAVEIIRATLRRYAGGWPTES